MLAWTALFLVLQSWSATWELTGQVTSLDGKTPLYTEHHRVELDEKGLNKKIESQYKKDGVEFARMNSDFSKSALVPDIEFTDSRFELKQELKQNEKKELVFRTLRKGQKEKTKTFSPTDSSVAGQGFDNFIKIKFDELQKSSVPLRFGVLEEMDFFSFTGKSRPALSADRARFGIKLSNPLLSLFLKELEVEYDVATRKLSSYRGLSNILDEKGKGQNVLIQYTWKEVKSGN